MPAPSGSTFLGWTTSAVADEDTLDLILDTDTDELPEGARETAEAEETAARDNPYSTFNFIVRLGGDQEDGGKQGDDGLIYYIVLDESDPRDPDDDLYYVLVYGEEGTDLDDNTLRLTTEETEVRGVEEQYYTIELSEATIS